MKLIVFYSFHVQQDFDEDKFFERFLIINAPDTLLLSEFKDYAYGKYFDQILSLEESCNNGAVYNLGIDNVEYIKEIE